MKGEKLQNLSLIFHIFSLVVFIILSYMLALKNQKLSYQRKIFEKLQSEKGKLIDNPAHFINFLVEEFNLNLKQNVKIEKPSAILVKKWFHFILDTKLSSLSWLSSELLELEVIGTTSHNLDGALGKDIKIVIKEK